MGRVWDLIFDFAERGGGMLCCRKLKENELLILSLFLLFFSFILSSSHTCSCSSCSGLQLTRPPKRTRCPASLPPCVSLLSSAWRWRPERSVLTVLSFPWLFRPGCYIGPLGVSKSVSSSWWCFLAALAPPTAPTQLLFG